MNFYSSFLTPNFSLLTPHSSLLTPHSSLQTSHSKLLTFDNFRLLKIAKLPLTPNQNAAHSPFGKNS